MKDLGVHLLLFALVAAGIVLLSAFFSEERDGAALAGLPRRFLVFFAGCAILAGVLIFLEHAFAS